MFITDLFEREFQSAKLINADKKGFTKKEHEELSKTLPWWSPKKWQFAIARFGLSTFGRLSKGIRVGWKEGFDSGSMLDYVYENEAKGFSPIGKFIDRQFLNSPGWRGIRKRKANLQKLLSEQIEDRLDNAEHVRVVDIAAGHGRYVLDTLQRYDNNKISAVLRDYSDINIRAGEAFAAKKHLKNVTYVKGNAFDLTSLAEISNAPNIAIVSGLYELFCDNDMILTSLKGLFEALEPGASLIYTNQPWHPQLEFIARVLTSHRDGNAWIMRRRTQQEMDQLVEAAGFIKETQEIDDQGIFTVSLARKPRT
nr:class I SAM-dependent methyltransferase family protein [Sneathiella glossodoripedis]